MRNGPNGHDAADLGFVGVDTGNSAIRRVFPLWARRLGLSGCAIRGFDIPLGAPRTAYRDAVTTIKSSDSIAGALVTTHKIDMFQTARDMFDDLCEYATICGEISSISKRAGRLRGHAKDPHIVGEALAQIVDPGYFARTGASVICLGAGGAGSALGLALAERSDRPKQIVLADIDAAALNRVESMMRRQVRVGPEVFTFSCLDATDSATHAATLVSTAPPGTLVVNATGMGKDRPGSPVGPSVTFPERAIVWEFNYRGRLDFATQARAQSESRSLSVHDGWRYFVRGWLQVVEDVYDIQLTPTTRRELADLAASVRTPPRAPQTKATDVVPVSIHNARRPQ